MKGHGAAELENSICTFLEKNKIKLSDCRGQSYDNGTNMSGLQARIRERNPLADYIPCFAHSLNLVGHSAVDNISAASKFYELVGNVYCLFSASTYQWELLVNVLGGLPIVKCLSDTGWASHSDASKALNCGYEKIRMVLEQFTENLDETAKARQEARGIYPSWIPSKIASYWCSGMSSWKGFTRQA